jgi:hypothetical protein
MYCCNVDNFKDSLDFFKTYVDCFGNLLAGKADKFLCTCPFVPEPRAVDRPTPLYDIVADFFRGRYDDSKKKNQ